MQDAADLVQKILNQVIESVFLKNLEPDTKKKEEFFDKFTDEESTGLNVERKLSEVSSGFEDLSDKIVLEDVNLMSSTPENQLSASYEEIFNKTIEEAINKLELQEEFKEVSIQTSPVGIDKECQCDLTFKLNGPPLKKVKTENLANCRDLPSGMEVTAQAESTRSERKEICERMSFKKQTPRIRVGLSKRARLQPLHMKLII